MTQPNKGLYKKLGPFLFHLNFANSFTWSNSTTSGEMVHIISLTTTVCPMLSSARAFSLIVGPIKLTVGWVFLKCKK